MKPTYFRTILLLCLCCACKKSTNESKPQPDQFSFVYNGSTYNYSITNNVANAGVYRNNGNPAILIDMPLVFGGQIDFIRAGCAYLAPENKVVYVNDPDCLLSIKDDYGNFQPIDSVQTYIYQSGSLNISFANCVTKSGTDFLTGLPYSYEVCNSVGTFELTLVNKNNQTIKITNGVVNELVQF